MAAAGCVLGLVWRVEGGSKKGHVIIRRYKYQEQLKNFQTPISFKSTGVWEGGNA